METVVPPGPLQAHLDGAIEYQRQHRQHAIADDGIELLYALDAELTGITLVDDGRRGEAIAQDEVAAVEGWNDHLGQVLCAVGEVEQQFSRWTGCRTCRMHHH